ncbi:MAG: transcriptional regulator [Chloroflexi bacterium RBG_13_66_10]|nr:MAG: transcriptional regulator [Chloroflexi bacterium RBG_13_66_10]
METEELFRLLPLLAPLVLIQLALLVIGLVDLARRERTRGPKWAWALVIVFVSMMGPIIYFLFGREEG